MMWLILLAVAGATEAEWVEYIATNNLKGAETDVRLFDGTRVDMIHDQYSIEVDRAEKWAEGIGQAQFYSEMTGKEGVLLLLMDVGDEHFVYRAMLGLKPGLSVWAYDIRKKDFVLKWRKRTARSRPSEKAIRPLAVRVARRARARTVGPWGRAQSEGRIVEYLLRDLESKRRIWAFQRYCN